MNRSQFLRTVSERTKAHRRDVEHVWEHALATIQEAVRKGEDVSITGFGKFKQKVTAARKAGLRKDPFTGEMRNFPARPAKKAPRFLPAKQFKEFVAGKGAMKVATKPMALDPSKGNGKAAPKKAAAKKKAAPKKKAAKGRRR